MFYTVNSFRIELEKNGLAIGEQFVRNAIKRQDIKSSRVGKRIFIPEEELTKIIGQRTNSSKQNKYTDQTQKQKDLTKNKLIASLKDSSEMLLAYWLERCIFLVLDNEKRIMRIAVPKNINKTQVNEMLSRFMGKYESWEIFTEYKETRMLDEAKQIISKLSIDGCEECKDYMSRWELI